jgi:uncharacterized membrane protein (UPF0127 family)
VSYTRIERATIMFPRTLTKVDVPVASSVTARATGLHGRTRVAPNDGMLFSFSGNLIPTMTMTGMLTALDFLFIDGHGRVVGLMPDVQPGVPVVSPDRAVKYVLELGPGFLRQMGPGVRVGDALRIGRYHASG